jgi:hypothetical protein
MWVKLGIVLCFEGNEFTRVYDQWSCCVWG